LPGILYVVATPIGNLEDITARAARVLNEVDLIAAEDTRHSRILIDSLKKKRDVEDTPPPNVKTPVFSCHKFNEGKRGDFFVGELLAGRSIALISDAGTPCISDPGFRLVQAAAAAGIEVVPVCGASAVVAALSVCGFEASRFTFLGFLPRGKAAAGAIAAAFAGGHNEVAVFYESPRRIAATLQMVDENFPTAMVCLCNDISKKFERIYRGSAADVLAEILDNPNAEKGEYTCVVHFVTETSAKSMQSATFSIEARLVDIIIKTGGTLKDASRELHAADGVLSKKEIYAAMLRLKEMFE